MTLDTYSTQAAIMAYLAAETGVVVYDTDFPTLATEPMENNVPAPYCVVRSNDTVGLANGGSFGGSRYMEGFSLVDVLVVAATPEEVRELAFGPDGVNDVLIGYRPDDNTGELSKRGGGQVYVGGDGSAVRPTRYIGRLTFRFSTNLTV